MAHKCSRPVICSGTCSVGAVDYIFYQDEFGGEMSAEEFARILPQAERHVKWMSGNPELSGAPADVVICWKRAI